MPLLGLFGYAAMLGVFPFILLLPMALPFAVLAQLVRWLQREVR